MINAKIILLVLSFMVCSCGCTLCNLTEKSGLAFNRWDERDSAIKFRPVFFSKSEAPNKQFYAEGAWEDSKQYSENRNVLSLVHVRSGQKIMVGRSWRGFNVSWAETQLGDLLLVEHHIDAHHRECFVLFPHVDKKGMLTFAVLYATPNQDICESGPEGIPAEHIYPTIKHVSYDGIMTLDILWSYYIPEDVGKRVEVKLPLFYGFQESESGKRNAKGRQLSF